MTNVGPTKLKYIDIYHTCWNYIHYNVNTQQKPFAGGGKKGLTSMATDNYDMDIKFASPIHELFCTSHCTKHIWGTMAIVMDLFSS